MIDLHTHVLPGIDDGPPDMAGALRLAATAAAEGVRVLAATPHLRSDHPGVRPEELQGRVDAVRDELKRAGVAVEVVVGGEVDLLWAQQAGERALRQVSYGQRGTDLLVETPYGELPVRLEEMLFTLAAQGFRVLLAHPERSAGFREQPKRLGALVARGTLLQVTAGSLAGPARHSRSHRFARQLVREGLAHVIASDAHGGDLERAGLAAGLAAAAELAPRRAEWMVTDAPAAILSGESLSQPPAADGGRGLRRRAGAWILRRSGGARGR
jgi:protein-tyrosine phosphatase